MSGMWFVQSTSFRVRGWQVKEYNIGIGSLYDVFIGVSREREKVVHSV